MAKLLSEKYNIDKRTGYLYRYIVAANERQVLHHHEFYEIFLTLTDGIVHIINGAEQQLKKGTLVFIRKSDVHCYKMETNSENMINLAFKAEIVDRMFDFLGDGYPKHTLLSSFYPPTVVLDDKQCEKVLKQLSELNSVDIENPDKQNYNMRLILMDLFTKYFVKAAEKDDKNGALWFNDLCEKMHNPENFIAGISAMEALCKKSYKHISRTIKETLNLTPSEFINDIRVNYAANLLINSNFSVIDVCFESGFNNVSWFHKCFKEKYGITPKKFRESYSIHTNAK